MRAVMMKEFRELRRDRRTVAMLIGMPLMLLVIFGFAANFTIDTLTVAAVGPQAQMLAEQAHTDARIAERLDIVSVDPAGTDADARNALRTDAADVAIVTGGTTPIVYIDGTNIFAAQSAKVLVAGLGDSVQSQILFNPSLNTSWVMVPALIGLIMAFIGTLITSIGMVKERESGTLEQLAVMPLRPMAVIVGKITPYMLLASFDMVLVTLLGMWIFDVPFAGNPAWLALGGILFLFVVMGLGTLISTVSHTTGQAVQAAIMVMLPQVLLSGFIFPLGSMAAGIRWIGYLLPLTWFTKVSQGVMLRAAGWDYLWFPLAVLAVMAIIIFGAAAARLGRELAPAKARTSATAHTEGATR